MEIVWENLKVGTPLKLRVCLGLAVVVTGLWVMVMAVVGFDLWKYWYVGLGWIWFILLTWWSVVARSRQQRITSLPLSFTLPGYHSSLHRLNFVGALLDGLAGLSIFIGIASILLWLFGNVASSMASLERMAPTSLSFALWEYPFQCPMLLLQCLGAMTWFIGRMASSFLSRAVPLVVAGKGRSIAIFAAVTVDAFFMLLLIGGTPFFGIVWPIVLMFSFGVLVFLWRRMGDRSRVVQCHRLMLGEAVGKKRMGSERRGNPSLEHVFIGAIERYRDRPGGCYLWGSLYQTFGVFPSLWKKGLLLLIALPVTGFMPGFGGVYVFAILAVTATRVDLPATSILMLPAGRRERYSAMVVVAAAMSCLLALAGLGLTMVSQIMASLFSSLGWHTFVALSPATTCLPALLTPALIGFVLLDYTESRWVARIGRFVLGFGLVGVLILNLLLVDIDKSESFRFVWGLRSGSFAELTGLSHSAVLVTAFVVAWVCFLLILHYVLAKGCLFRPDRSKRTMFGARK